MLQSSVVQVRSLLLVSHAAAASATASTQVPPSLLPLRHMAPRTSIKSVLTVAGICGLVALAAYPIVIVSV